jgi:hypothetical protein
MKWEMREREGEGQGERRSLIDTVLDTDPLERTQLPQVWLVFYVYHKKTPYQQQYCKLHTK